MSRPARRPGSALDHAASPLAGALNREWRRDYELGNGPAPAAWRAETWLAGFGRVFDALACIEDPASSPGCAEGVLRALARKAETGDAEAARVLVQYLLPCLVHTAAVRVRCNRSQAVDEMVSAAWEVVRTGVELRGRPVKIALLRSIEYRALRQPARIAQRQADREILVGATETDFGSRRAPAVCIAGRPVRGKPNAGEELLAALSEAVRRGARGDDVGLIGRLAVGGWTNTRIALAEGVSERMVRYRRASAVRRLACLLRDEYETQGDRRRGFIGMT